MSRKIEVNGSLLDENYFNENISEAKSRDDWAPVWWEVSGEHTHCLICLNPIPKVEGVKEKYYRSKNRVICNWCFEKFME